MDAETLERMVRTMQKAHLSMYDADREFEIPNPVYFLFRGEKIFRTVPMNMPRPVAHVMRDALSAACDAFGVDVFMHVSEAYAKTITGAERIASMPRDSEGFPTGQGSLSEDPEAVEMLYIHAGHRSGLRISAGWRINREARTRDEILFDEVWTTEKDLTQVASRWDLWDRPSLKREIILGEPES